jgi:hypothetical protein
MYIYICIYIYICTYKIVYLHPYIINIYISIPQGYSAGALARTVRAIVTRRRVIMLKQRPLNTTDFIDNLSLQDVTYKDDKQVHTYMCMYIFHYFNSFWILSEH